MSNHQGILQDNVPTGDPHLHRRNAAERAIHTFKAQFLSILSGADKSFHNYLWGKILPHAEVMLNLLRKSALSPAMSAWEHFNGPLNYDANPLGPSVCRIRIHSNPNTRLTWGFCGRAGYSIGPGLHHYRCHTVVDAMTQAEVICYTVEYRHSYVIQPTLTPEYRIIHALKFLSCAIHNALATAHHNQLEAIAKLRDLFVTYNP